MALLAFWLFLPACGPSGDVQEHADADGTDDRGREIVDRAIEAHGGDRFRNSAITFDFRGERFRVVHRDGIFHYERIFPEDGRTIREWIDNEGAHREVDGVRQELSPEEELDVEISVNAVVYLAFVPHRLDEPAVRTHYLEETEVEGEPYHKVEVTFRQEGGGQDWQDRYVYWFHRDRHTMDYFAYRFQRGGEGSRFRVATNPRKVDGILIQDYRNLRFGEIEDIADYDRAWERGEAEFVSDVNLENVEVRETPEQWRSR